MRQGEGISWLTPLDVSQGEHRTVCAAALSAGCCSQYVRRFRFGKVEAFLGLDGFSQKFLAVNR